MIGTRLSMGGLVLLLVSVAWADSSPCTQPAPSAGGTGVYVYKTTSQGPLRLHVNFSADFVSSQRRPAMLFFYGGGWQGGSVAQFAPQAKYFADRGLVTFRAEYRTKRSHGVMPDKCVEDAESALRWIRQHAVRLGVDPDRIIVSGGSAGGHLAACTAGADGTAKTVSDSPVSARANVLVLYNPVLNTTDEWVVNRYIGGNMDVGRRIDPGRRLHKDNPPALVFFGSKDRFYGLAKAYLARARELGCRVELKEAPGQNHGFFNKSPWLERTTRQADEFLISLGYLKGQPRVPECMTQPAGKTAGKMKRRPRR